MSSKKKWCPTMQFRLLLSNNIILRYKADGTRNRIVRISYDMIIILSLLQCPRMSDL